MMRPDRVRSLSAVAHHESAHAFSALALANREATVLGLELTGHADGAASGQTFIDTAGMSDRDQLTITFAGKTAEFHFGFIDNFVEDPTALGDENDVVPRR